MENFITMDGETRPAHFDDANLTDPSEILRYFRDESVMPLGRLAKYYLNENLHFLCGSGTSVSLGGKTINSSVNVFQDLVAELKSISPLTDTIDRLINYFEGTDILEVKFDKINQEYLYQLNVRNDKKAAIEIKHWLNRALSLFIETFVPFPVEYVKDKLEIHELFINKIISRKETMSRPKIFTPNYDLAFENACEKLGISYNNGFRGVHMRKFDPDTFNNETYIKQEIAEKAKRISTYLNLYKLHGSISWQYSDLITDMYNIREVQVSDRFSKADFEVDSLMIYPIQTKKSYSLDLPYSEIFRSFSRALSENQNTLVVLGYSFLDEHINDIILSGLYNPNLSLIVHSYSVINDSSPSFLKTLKLRSIHDSRISVFEGNLVGNFSQVVTHLIPLNSFVPPKESLIETLKQLMS